MDPVAKRDILLGIFLVVMWSVYIMWITVSAGAAWLGAGACLLYALFAVYTIKKRIER